MFTVNEWVGLWSHPLLLETGPPDPPAAAFALARPVALGWEVRRCPNTLSAINSSKRA